MNVHIAGIGGIGVSALAGYFLAKGHGVSGSDIAENESVRSLRNEGARIATGPHQAENVPASTDMLVYSPAVPETNAERREAMRRGIPVRSYPEALGEIAESFMTVAVAGTHGKSTTTAMIALILVRAGLDPTVILGTKLKEFGGKNYRVGSGAGLVRGRFLLVIEADEYAASFLNYSPDIAVITNIDEDHLDFYKTREGVIAAFRSFAGRIREQGSLIGNGDDEAVQKIMEERQVTGMKVVPFSWSQREARDMARILQVPGAHNVENALAALSVARELGVSDEDALGALAAYRGSWRRFEIFSLSDPVLHTLVSDYGHHPTEIAATVRAARERWPHARIILVFQPHQRQRTRLLFRAFVRTLSQVPADLILLTDIYDVAGREQNKEEEISSRDLADAIVRENPERGERFVRYVPFSLVLQETRNEVREGDIVLFMGAGSIGELSDELTEQARGEKMNNEGGENE